MSVGTGTAAREKLARGQAEGDSGFAAGVLYSRMRGGRLQLAGPDHPGDFVQEAVAILKQIFHPLVMRGVPVIVTNHETAELVREAATAFVATKISFINELAGLCEQRKRRRSESLAGAWAGQEDCSPLLAAGRGHGRICSRSPTWIRWRNWHSRKACR